jgi:hypothetical protein
MAEGPAEDTTEGSSHIPFANICFSFAFHKREHKVNTEKMKVPVIGAGVRERPLPVMDSYLRNKHALFHERKVKLRILSYRITVPAVLVAPDPARLASQFTLFIWSQN